MTFFPILDRELRGRSRHRGTYWTRFSVGLVGALVCLPYLALPGLAATPASLGKNAFNGLLGAGFLLCCGACLLTADMISAERRDGTLGLLFLTRVRSLDVLIGKLGSIGITSMCALLSLLPVMMIPLLVGGVTGGEAFRSGLALLNALFFSLAAGLCASAPRADRFKAARDALAMVGIVVFAPFVIELFLFHGHVVPALALFSPLCGLFTASDTAYLKSPLPFWLTIGAVQGGSWLLLAGAQIRLHRAMCEQELPDQPKPATREPGREIFPRTGPWPPVAGDGKPMEWLVERQRMNGLVWAVAALGLAYNGWVGIAHGAFGLLTQSMPWLAAWPVGVAAGLLGGAIAAWVSSRFFLETRRTRELELILVTPTGADRIVPEQWRELRRLFPFPVMLLQAPIVCLIWAGMSSVGGGAGPDVWVWLLFCLANTYVGVGALCWLGLWLGLRARGQTSAVVWAVSVALGLPYLLDLLFLALAPAPGAGAGPSPGFFVVPKLLTLAFYGWLHFQARHGVGSELRRTNSQLLPVPAT